MAYTRIFIPLECEASGYGFKGRTPAGRSIVENRNGEARVSVWAQDLRPDARYETYIVFSNEGGYVGVSAGKINPDAKGKVEFRKEIDPHAIGHFKVEDLVAAAIIVADAEGGAIVSPLCGYQGKAVSWRSGFARGGVRESAVAEVVEGVVEGVVEKVAAVAKEPESVAVSLPEPAVQAEVVEVAEEIVEVFAEKIVEATVGESGGVAASEGVTVAEVVTEAESVAEPEVVAAAASGGVTVAEVVTEAEAVAMAEAVAEQEAAVAAASEGVTVAEVVTEAENVAVAEAVEAAGAEAVTVFAPESVPEPAARPRVSAPRARKPKAEKVEKSEKVAKAPRARKPKAASVADNSEVI